MSTPIAKSGTLTWTQFLVLVAILAAVLGLTGKTFYDVMKLLNNVSSANYFYREAFRFQVEWRLNVDKIGRITACSADRLTGTGGTIVLDGNQMILSVGTQVIRTTLPNEVRAVPAWDRAAGLAVLNFYRRNVPENPPLRLVAVTRTEGMP